MAAKRYGSIASMRYCCFLFCWSMLLLTIVCVFNGPQNHNLPTYDYTTDAQGAAAPYSTTGKSAADSGSGRGKSPSGYEVVPDPNHSATGWDERFMEMVRSVEKQVPSLPFDFWQRQHLKGDIYREGQCANLPSLLELQYSNEYWQTQRTSNGTFELFGAYLDNRKTIPGGDQFVRLLGMVDRVNISTQMHCQLWYDDIEASYVVPVHSYNYVWNKDFGGVSDTEYQPYLISCRLPTEMRNTVPAAVSLVENKCDRATNALRVIYNKPVSPQNRRKFVVCVKALDFLHEDQSVRLVEWIELISLLGADKIVFYELEVHPNIRRVLDHYQQEGRVDVVRDKLPGGKPTLPELQHIYIRDRKTQKRQHEVIGYNDCLYKYMYHYEYVVLLDIDEVIMPTNNIFDWPQLAGVLLEKGEAKANSSNTLSSFEFRNSYFLDEFYSSGQRKPRAAVSNTDVPEFLHMLRHTSRSKEYSAQGSYVKCFYRTNHVLTLHNHFAIECVEGPCYTSYVDVNEGQLQHYRRDCKSTGKENCAIADEFVEDQTINRFKTKLINRSLSTLLRLQLIRAA